MAVTATDLEDELWIEGYGDESEVSAMLLMMPPLSKTMVPKEDCTERCSISVR